MTITAREKEIAEILEEDGPISIAGIADLIGCSKKRVKNIIGTLKRNGYAISQELNEYEEVLYSIEKEIKGRKPRILIWDIETSPMVVAIFDLKQNGIIHYENILQDWFIICASWKWLGEEEVYTTSIIDNKKEFKKDNTNDFDVVKKLSEVITEADVIVAHNGDRFDLKKLNARAIYHGLEPVPPVKTVDTLKEAKKYFNFSSNRLDYLAKHLDVGEKMHTTKGLWLRALDGDEEAIQEMLEYNVVDTVVLESVYLKLRPYMIGHPNLNLITGEGYQCPKCTSFETQKRGFSTTRAGLFQRYWCKSCRGWTTDGKSLARTGLR